MATLDFGESFSQPGVQVIDLVRPALWNSTQLVFLALVLTLPISILSGVLAAYRKDTAFDRSVVTLGLASASNPDFVSGILLQYLIGVRLGWLPATANAPRGTGFIAGFEFILLPAVAIAFVYFGYIARVTRAGAIEAFESDYVRTAVMKGLSLRSVVTRHVLRNSLQPTVAVTGTQMGFLFGGLIALEFVFNYPGPRWAHPPGGQGAGLPASAGRCAVGRRHLHVLDAGRRPPDRLDEPAGQAGSGLVTDTSDMGGTADTAGPGDRGDSGGLKQVRAEQRRQLLRSPSFLIGAAITGFWVSAATVPGLLTTRQPNEAVRIDGSVIARQGPSADAWFGTDAIGNDVYTRVIYGSRSVLTMAPLAALIAVVAGATLGLLMGYYRGWLDEILSRIIEAILSLPVILLALMVLVIFGNSRTVIVITVASLFAPVVTRTVRTAVIGETNLDYVTSATLRGESGPYIMAREILPNVSRVFVVELTVRVGYAIFTISTLAFLGLTASDSTAPDWGLDIANSYRLVVSDQWWPSVFPALAIATLVIGINLIADSIEQVTRQ